MEAAEEIRPYFPSKDALRKRIKRVRKAERMTEPQTQEVLKVHPHLRRTLSGEFLGLNLYLGLFSS